ncbi:hypothetical protein [Caulobacter sp. 1776]|uniref:hypothetical protein n=1 Tax=Caulobacter sp. 1776 TaxID=3156420 RepID=UPI0033997C25
MTTERDRILPPSLALWSPVVAAILYPWGLRAFHAAVAPGGGGTVVAVVWLAVAFALPLSCLALALPGGASSEAPARRLAFAGLTAPPLFVLVGVLAGLLHSPVEDIWIWPMLWIALGTAASFGKASEPAPETQPMTRLRIAHGVSAVLILLFVAFHLFNHLTGLIGPDVHARVMKFGRVVYRSRVIEPVLVILLLFQVSGGVQLAWRWSARPLDLAKAIQVGSGAYLAAFILTHMNSAFVSARAVHKIQTDWAWATGAPEGLLASAWNIRLVPHYALGAFFVVVHLVCGLRQVLLAHGVRRELADRAWGAGLAGAAALSAAITAGLCGVRI